MCPLRNCISRFPTPWGEMPRVMSGIKKSMRLHAELPQIVRTVQKRALEGNIEF